MSPGARRWLYWAPRALTILFAVFISLFALDVFDGRHSLVESLVGLAIHHVPTGLILVPQIVARRWEWVGALLFAGLGVAYVVMAWGDVPAVAHLLIAGPAVLVGVLFLLGWLYRKELRARG